MYGFLQSLINDVVIYFNSYFLFLLGIIFLNQSALFKFISAEMKFLMFFFNIWKRVSKMLVNYEMCGYI